MNNVRKGLAVLGGGTGFVGTAVKTALENHGYEVITVTRQFPGDFNLSWQDIQEKGLPQHTKVVINVAGQNVLDPLRSWSPGFKQNVYASRVKTTGYLASAIERAVVKPDVFLTISGVGFYEPHPYKEYDESDSGGDFDFLSRLCTDWEAASRVNSVRTVNIRSGVVLGRQGGMIDQLTVPFYLGLGGPVGSGNQYMPWIHIYDIGELFVHCIEKKEISGPVNGVAPDIITNKQFAQTYGKTIRRPAFIPLPTPIVNFIFSEERAKIMTDGQKVLPKKALDSGYKFLYPTIESAAKEFGRFLTY